MARRTEAPGKPDVGGAGQPPQLSPSTGQRPFWLGWAALAIVIAAGVGLIVSLSMHSNAKPQVRVKNLPRTSSPAAPTPSAAAPSVSAVPATTYDAFAAMSPPAQQAVMQQAITNYLETLSEASRTMDASSLPQVATGDELPVLQQAIAQAAQNHQPLNDVSHDTVQTVAMSPQPFSFVSVNVSYAETSQYLDPTTLRPIGSPNSTSGQTSFSLVIEGGVWKVSEHIQEPTS